MQSKIERLLISTQGGDAVVVAYSTEGHPVTKIRDRRIQLADLWDLQTRFPRATELGTVGSQAVDFSTVPDWPKVSKNWPVRGSLEGISILLDPGHSKSSPGARGLGDRPPLEHDMNLLQAKILAEEFRREGAHVSIVDPDPDDLSVVAMEANSKNLYLSLHHDAFDADGVDEGTSVHVYPGANIPTKALAKDICNSIASALNSKNRGVKFSKFKILNVSENHTDCPLNMLVESYFIDDYDDLDRTRKRSTAAARAIALAVISFFEEYPQHPSREWMATKTFESSKDLQLSRNFFLREFVCRCGCEFTKVSGKLVKQLQRMRDRVGGPVNLNSGYRCARYNASIGGVSNSQHIFGCAADIVAPGLSQKTIYPHADNLFDGVGRYASFTHVDVRGYKARW